MLIETRSTVIPTLFDAWPMHMITSGQGWIQLVGNRKIIGALTNKEQRSGLE